MPIQWIPLRRAGGLGRIAVLVLVAAASSFAALPTLAAPQVGRPQTEADSYTRYELLDPETESFRIVYDVSATTQGATRYWNPIRRGSAPTVHGVVDLYTGRGLPHRLVSGASAAEHGLVDADPEGQYIEIDLARAVPAGGEARLRIDKTYRDGASYHRLAGDGAGAGERFVFERALGIPRNTVALPPGFELVACNVPVQVRLGAEDRVEVSFLERGPGPTPLRLVGRRLPSARGAASGGADARVVAPAGGAIEVRAPETTRLPASARLGFEFAERARQDREIVYFLEAPETHSFRLYHDYTESRPGVDRYLNVVRPGSRASKPSARLLDTGEDLRVETLRGSELARRGIELEDDVGPDTEVVVIWFPPVEPGRSVRLRIEETYTDPGRYGLDGAELLFDRSLGRPRNVVVLPEGFWLTASVVPAAVDETDDGKVRLRFDNDGPDAISVLVRARRR